MIINMENGIITLLSVFYSPRQPTRPQRSCNMGGGAKRNRQTGNTLYTNSKPINKDHLNSDRNYSTGPRKKASSTLREKSNKSPAPLAEEMNKAPEDINNSPVPLTEMNIDKSQAPLPKGGEENEEQKISNISNGASSNQAGKELVVYSSSLNITNNKKVLPYFNLAPLSFNLKPHNIPSLQKVDPRFLH
jgi:hypothetical protein